MLAYNTRFIGEGMGSYVRCCSLDCTRLMLYCSSNSCLTLEGTTLLLELQVKQVSAVRAATEVQFKESILEEFVESSLVGRGLG